MAKIIYKGDIFSPSGYSNAIRNYIRCLLDLGHKVAIDHNPHDSIQIPPQNFDFTKRLSKFSLNEADILIDQETPEFYEPKKNLINIAYCVWETDKLPTDFLNWAENLNKMDFIFVPTKFCKRVFQKSGVKKPIYIIPHIIDTEKFKPGRGLKIQGLKDDNVVFLASFQWTRRKNPDALFLAYLSEFTPEDKVSLVLKTYWADFSLQSEEFINREVQKMILLSGIQKHPPVFLLNKEVDDKELPLIYQIGDIFVSTSSGEGFCLPAAEAMSCGCVPIINNWSGQAELISKNGEDGFLVDYILEPAVKVTRSAWYNCRQNWAKIKISQLKKVMRKVYELKQNDPEKFKEMSRKARQSIVDKFSYGAVSKILEKAIQEVMQLR